MNQEMAGKSVDRERVFTSESLPFSEIPGQTKLFTQYQEDPLSLTAFYPTAVASHVQVADRVSEVLARYAVDRNDLCEALLDINRNLGAGDTAIANVERLRRPDSVAVVTGQQAGLFSGPLYTVYKALSAVRMANCLTDRGVNAVPVFWIASEDHDFDEVSETSIISRSGGLKQIGNHPAGRVNGAPVGNTLLDGSVRSSIDELFANLGVTEFSSDLKETISSSYSPGVSFATAFGKLLTLLTAKFGLVMIDPLDVRLKALAAPIYVDAIGRTAEMGNALRERSKALIASGYHAQIHIDDGFFPLFWHADDGTRNAMRASGDGKWKTKCDRREFSTAELAEMAASEPSRFSPNVAFRGVVQDYLLPTICYFGGAAEIAYFAQSGEVYRILDRPITPVLHRQSFTIVEKKDAKVLRKFEIEFRRLFDGMDALLPDIVDKHIDKDSALVFERVEEAIKNELDRLDQFLSGFDITLADNLAHRRKKIIYHITALRSKTRRSQLERDATVKRQIGMLFDELLPAGQLQERSINTVFFLNRYGPQFIDWIYEAADLSDTGHRILYLK